MATYESGEDPQVGDRVACINPRDTNLVYDGRYQVLGVNSGKVAVNCPGDRINFCPLRFKLISRAPSPPHEPLVKWPEEKKRIEFSDLQINELFVFADGRDYFVRQKIGDGTFVTLAFEWTESPCGYNSTLKDRPVRRLKMIRSPQFEVA